MHAPDVSVVIPTRNRRALLRRALRTVLGQQGVAVEVVVVDEASHDGTGDFVTRLGDPRISLVRHDAALGVGAARNAGIARARAPWVGFLDDDDLWAPDKLAAQLEVAARTDAAWVYVGAVIINEALDIVSGARPLPRSRLRRVLAYNYVPGGGSGTMVRTDLARSIGGFDTQLGVLADWEMWIRLALAAPAAAVPRPLVAYLRHSGSMSHVNDRFIADLEYIQQKHAGVRDLWGVRMERDRWMRWAAGMQLRSRNTRDAVQTYLEIARRYGDRKSIARAVVGGLYPDLLLRYWRWHARRLLSNEWQREAEAWLAPLRRAFADDAAPVEDSAALATTGAVLEAARSN